MDNWIILLTVILVVAVAVVILLHYPKDRQRRTRITKASRPRQQIKVGVTVADRKINNTVHPHQTNRQQRLGSIAIDPKLPIANNSANDTSDKQPHTNKELADIFGDEDDEPQQDNSPSLDDQHRRLLYQLLPRSSLSKDELTDLARKYCLMPDGAIETINHWAHELCQDPLVIDNNDCWEIDRDIANRLNSGGKDGNN